MKVNIIYPSHKKTWILQRMAKKLENSLDYVVTNHQNKDDFDINYYINYALFREKSKNVDMAYFTHIEQNIIQKNRFFKIAKTVDYSVCLSKLYLNALKEKGIENIVQIVPGVDLNHFNPKLVLGFVGRYPNLRYKNRKGKKLLDETSRLSFVDVKRTEGELSFGSLPDFYRGLDYVLITSKYEGGPMCLIEGLACGIPIIAPEDIGLVPEFENGIYKYKTSDFNSLKNILYKLYNKKEELANEVSNLTWTNFIRKHDLLFNTIYKKNKKKYL